jgi:hypothetical protein
MSEGIDAVMVRRSVWAVGVISGQIAMPVVTNRRERR